MADSLYARIDSIADICDRPQDRELVARLIRELLTDVCERCACIAENTEAGDGSHDYNAGAETMQERIAKAIRNDRVPACLCGQPISDECRANGCRWDKEKEHG